MDLYPRSIDSGRLFRALLQLYRQHLYLIQERNLETKAGMHGFWSRLPALATIDEIGFKCLIWGFPFMTLG